MLGNIPEKNSTGGTTTMSYDKIMTLEEVAKVLKISNGQLRKLLKDGEIKAFKLGKYKWRIPKAAVEEYVKGKMAG